MVKRTVRLDDELNARVEAARGDVPFERWARAAFDIYAVQQEMWREQQERYDEQGGLFANTERQSPGSVQSSQAAKAGVEPVQKP